MGPDPVSWESPPLFSRPLGEGLFQRFPAAISAPKTLGQFQFRQKGMARQGENVATRRSARSGISTAQFFASCLMRKFSIEYLEIIVLENLMKRTTVTLPRELVEDLLDVTPAKNKTQAVVSAIQDCIRRKKLETIKNLAGQGRWPRTVKA